MQAAPEPRVDDFFAEIVGRSEVASCRQIASRPVRRTMDCHIDLFLYGGTLSRPDNRRM